MKKRVVILKIDDYDKDLIKERIKETIYKYFSINIESKEKILLKPNLLLAAAPEEAITTHPIVIESVGNIFKERGNPIFIVDSPGGFLNKTDLDYIYKKTGIYEISDKNNFKLLYPDSFFLRDNLPLCWWTDSFKIINIPKLKTHEITTLTLATKNLYGCIYGDFKSHLHLKYPKIEDFVRIILTLYKTIKPFLNIVDGILALEGNGPAKGGKPKKLGLIFIGDDALYTDYAISKTLKLPIKLNPLIKLAKELSLLSEDNLEIISDYKDIDIDFRFPSPHILNYLPSFSVSFIKSFLKFYPRINNKKCKLCLLCKNNCSAKAIYIKKNGELGINLKKCIMCMCCMEVCEFGAVELDRNLILKIISRFL